MGQKPKTEAKKEEGSSAPMTVILKVDMHCDGCASKIVRCIRGFEGVESMKADSETGKLTIIGNVDPAKVRDKLSRKMKKQVELLSPLPSKEKDKENKSKTNDKPKEPPVTTAVLKVSLHCQGCIERIRRTVLKTKGVYEMAIDKEKETVTVKGTMDVKALVGNLTERLKRNVEVIPPKKDKDKDKDKEKEKEKENEKEGAAPDKGGNAGAKKKKKGGGAGGGGGGGGDKNKDEEGGGGGDGQGKTEQQSKMEFSTPAYGGYGYGYGYGADAYNYSPLYMGQLHAPQMFSDENPNACSLM